MSEVEYHRLRPAAAVARRQARSVAYLGCGILEWHGLHNPLGLDCLKAHGIACHLAAELGGVAMPPLYWGDNRADICEIVFDEAYSPWLPAGTGDHTAAIMDAMQTDKAAYAADAERSRTNGDWQLWERLLVHMLFQIETLGFRQVVVIPGHYPLIGPLQRAVAAYQAQGGASAVFVLTDMMTTDDGKAGDHAAAFETSLLLALAPECVDLTALGDDLATPPVGVLGADPRGGASAALGRAILTRMTDLVRQFLEGT